MGGLAGSSAPEPHPFGDLERFLAIPRLASLALSPDGLRLATVVSELAPEGKTWQPAVWEVDPQGRQPARRLTRSAKGEAGPVFTPNGGLLFTSARANPEAAASSGADDDAPTALWLLPPSGEARQVHGPGGGVHGVVVAREAGTIVLTIKVHPGVAPGKPDDDIRSARKDAGVTAILHESYPVRDWDHDLGPDRPRLLLAGGVPAGEEGVLENPIDLVPEVGDRLSGDAAVSPDGRLVAYGYHVDVSASYGRRATLRLVASDGSGDRPLADVPGFEFSDPAFAPDADAGWVVCLRHTEATLDEPPDSTLVRVDLADGRIEDLTAGFEHWPTRPVVSPDGAAVFFTADCGGRCPVWRLDVARGSLTRLTGAGSYTDLCVSPDSAVLYALRAALDAPPQPVRIDATAAGQDPVRLPAPGAVERLPGTLTEIGATADDGTPLRAWLVLPETASEREPAPLLLWVHGGPLMSWNSWSWRWNPWTAAARGYAVLLPDPALSSGYGQDFVRRGWSAWGGAPYTDLMAVTDAAARRPDVDERRTAAMGGSFGGYLANWIATQTDRFSAIVTHASLWHLDAFTGTTDFAYYWLREVGDPLADPYRLAANSPHLRVADICTPMLVIHGDKDYRVPIGEGLRLFFDLVRHEVPARLLYFPTENHWVLTPGNARVWYETVFAFLAEHVRREGWIRPELL